MYRQLLAVALLERPPHPGDPDEEPQVLLERLAEQRHQLLSAGAGTSRRHADPAAAVALQLRYDVALIHLCSALGIDYQLDRFSQPAAAREALEQSLRRMGLDLDHRPHGSGGLAKGMGSNGPTPTSSQPA